MLKGTLELDQSVLHELEALAQGLNKSPEGLVTSLIQGLARNQQDDLALMAEGDKVLAEFEAQGGPPFDEVADWTRSGSKDEEKPEPQGRLL